MLKVYAIQSKEEQAALCAHCNITYDPDLLCYCATVDDIPVGICQFTLLAEGGCIYDLAPIKGQKPDKQALFVLGRATLNFIDLCNIHTAFFDGDCTIIGEQLLHAIGFRKNDSGRFSVDLTDFFKSPCQHEHGMQEKM